MASTAAGRVGVGAPSALSGGTVANAEVVAAGKFRGVRMALGGHKGRDVGWSCWGQPRLVATPVFFGAGVDRFVSRASNGSGPRTVAGVVNEAAVDGSTNNTLTKPAAPAPQEKPAAAAAESTPASIASAASVFMADVANLIKLVDTRDIVELELKQQDYELVIRKKEALPPAPHPQHPSPGVQVMAHTMFPGYQPQAPPQAIPHATSGPAAADAAPAPLPDAIPPAAEHPPMLSPMAGTFYKCPGPGEPPFVKVGDKVTKGQVVCIVEAMKLMNEIEADQSGTIVEILADDGKPVSIDTPLFVIKP